MQYETFPTFCGWHFLLLCSHQRICFLTLIPSERIMSCKKSRGHFLCAGRVTLLMFSPLFFVSSPLMALTIVGAGESRSIDNATPTDNYLVNSGGILNAHNAGTYEVLVQSGSTINATGGTFAGRNGNSGITLSNSQATLIGVTLTSDDAALTLRRQVGTLTGSAAVVTDSVLRGGIAGVAITGLSTLELNGGEVTGTLADSVGIEFFAGTVRANGTIISGDANGVRMALSGQGLAETDLTLDGATLEGRLSSAILVEEGVQADIHVLNNSKLLAGNNILLDVQGASTVTMAVANSTLQGNINIADGSTANLTFDQGQMTGDVLVDGSSSASVTLQNQSQFTGRLDKVASVNIDSHSNWTLTGNDSIGALGMNGGSVTFGAADAPATYYQLNVGALSGNGTFVMKGDFATGEHDFLNVVGASAGDFALAVAASGLDAVSPQQLTLARTSSTNGAQFALAGNSVVDVGTWSYSLANRENGEGGRDWFLDPTTAVISPGARSVLALFNTAPTVWYGELSSLRSRMGELRFNGGQAGGWIRTYGNKYNVADGSGTGYQQQQQGVSLGADARIGESQVLVGVLAGTSQSDLDLNRGTSGTVKSYYVGPYVTWLDSDTGYYVDGVLKFNRFRNESKVNLSDGSRTKGDYDNWGVGGSAEFGRHIKLADGYFIEPFTQLSAVQIQGKRYTLDNDMDADGDRMRSLLGKAGATFGRNFGFGHGAVAQPYVRAAVAHEFASNNEVKVNNNEFNNDLSGSRAEFGAGVAVAMSAQWQVHADFDYSKGEHIEQPWGANVGVRYSW
ncbi:autotransporter outer membrane beta-barrel domain-containing protein [Pseudomonas sp. NPDC087817]|uniref:autotransporter family protein n=1 Tax=Pseudomonas sp. NPDC087817 TaxID=3364451 RepID=UPI00382F9909